MFDKTKIKFKKDLTYPDLGNVWRGREIVVPHKQALRFVRAGLADIISPQKAIEPMANAAKIEAEPKGANNGRPRINKRGKTTAKD